MQLYSLQFVLFLLLTLSVYYLVGRFFGRGQWAVLLLASLSFYAICGWQNLVFILVTATSTWLAGRLFDRFEQNSKRERKAAEDRQQKKAIKKRWQHRKWIVTLVCLAGNFGILSYIKYWNVLLASFGAGGGSFLASHLLLPLGISFYTFQSMGYLIDVYNGKYAAERNWAKLLLFVSYFPQLIQGPINRFDTLALQLYERHSLDVEDCRKSLLLIGFGVLKKFAIAELLVKTISMCLDHIGATTPGSIIVFGILLYSVQQYCDFSGGIDMVRGVSQLFGIRMAENFRQPYFSVSLGDFWRRWHITLGAWMRDYVFYPFALRPSMRSMGEWCSAHLGHYAGRVLPACVANILVFFLVGLWHGAEAHYIWWGLYNGFVIALADIAAPLFKRMLSKLRIDPSTRLWHTWCVIRTFIVVNVGWYFDRIYDFGDCLQAFHNTFFYFRSSKFISTLTSFDIKYLEFCLGLAAIGCIVVFVVSVFREKGVDVSQGVLSFPVALRILIYLVASLLVLFSFLLVPTSGGFMYANF